MAQTNTQRPNGGSETGVRAYLQELLENLPPRSDELVPEASAWITFQGVEPFYQTDLCNSGRCSSPTCATAPLRCWASCWWISVVYGFF